MRSAIITGASSGIGEATAKALAKEGFAVTLAARSIDKLDELKSQIEGDGYKAIAIQCDVVKRLDMKEVAARTLSEFGGIDVLINNAGIMPLSFMAKLHEDEWEQTVDVNIKGVLNGIAAVLPTMMEQNKGHIINVSSVAGIKVFPSAAVYCGTKFAVEAISEGLRSELSKRFNIKVTSIRPGAVETNLTSTITDQDVLDWFASMSEGMEALQSEDIANGIVYAVTQADRVNVNEITIRPTTQEL